MTTVLRFLARRKRLVRANSPCGSPTPVSPRPIDLLVERGRDPLISALFFLSIMVRWRVPWPEGHSCGASSHRHSQVLQVMIVWPTPLCLTTIPVTKTLGKASFGNYLRGSKCRTINLSSSRDVRRSNCVTLSRDPVEPGSIVPQRRKKSGGVQNERHAPRRGGAAAAAYRKNSGKSHVR